ncbi:MAG: hypothetical protein BWY99_02273 [Synergistetes bacterium ADurb.BinA166]|nr:MAG: hypothetical protein BWY99_02273 [Synergistetes bacterium ADurb.BinA166]
MPALLLHVDQQICASRHGDHLARELRHNVEGLLQSIGREYSALLLLVQGYLRSTCRRAIEPRGVLRGRGPLHRVHYGLVAGAAAEVPRDPDPNLIPGRRRVPSEQRPGRHDHPRSAEAALYRARVEEGLLQCVGPAFRRKRLYCLDSAAGELQGGHHAGVHELPVEQHGACAALPLSATLLGAHQAQVLPQDVKQTSHRGGVHLSDKAIHSELEFHRLSPPRSSRCNRA